VKRGWSKFHEGGEDPELIRESPKTCNRGSELESDSKKRQEMNEE